MKSNFLCIFHMDLKISSLRPGVILETLRTVSELGYNAVLWELEDAVRFESCLEVANTHAFSKQEFRFLLEQASKLGLENIPLLQTFGHAEYILKHSAYAHLREQTDTPTCYCASSPDVRRFLKQMIEEYLELFGSSIRFFHFGGDEAALFGSCATCSKREPNELYAEHLDELAKLVTVHGIRVGIWSDMILKHIDTLERIPRHYLIWDWDYGAGPDPYSDENGNPVNFPSTHLLKNHGFDIVLCAASRSFVDSVFLPEWNIHSRNIAGAALKCKELELKGCCVTSWAIRLPLLSAQIPLLEIAPFLLKNPHWHLAELFRALTEKYFGSSDETMLRNLSRNDSSLIFLTKAPEPWEEPDIRCAEALKRHMKDIQQKEPDVLMKWKTSVNTLIEEHESALKKLNSSYSVTSEIWNTGAILHLRFLKLLNPILSGIPPEQREITSLTDGLAELLSKECAPAQARQNAELVFQALNDCAQNSQILHP